MWNNFEKNVRKLWKDVDEIFLEIKEKLILEIFIGNISKKF